MDVVDGDREPESVGSGQDLQMKCKVQILMVTWSQRGKNLEFLPRVTSTRGIWPRNNIVSIATCLMSFPFTHPGLCSSEDGDRRRMRVCVIPSTSPQFRLRPMPSYPLPEPSSLNVPRPCHVCAAPPDAVDRRPLSAFRRLQNVTELELATHVSGCPVVVSFGRCRGCSHPFPGCAGAIQCMSMAATSRDAYSDA